MAEAITEEGDNTSLNEIQVVGKEDGRDDPEGSRGWPSPSRKRGCMTCYYAHRVTHFDQLQPGDHIRMPGRTPLLGLLYSHHAIVKAVENVSDDGKTAKLTVIDVDSKGKLKSCLPCERETYQVKSHLLYDQTIHKLSNNMVCLSTDEVYLEKIHYRTRKFSKEASLKRANEYYRKKKEITVKYCFCFQNCEHFSTICVNGPNTLDMKNCEKGISKQVDNMRLFFSLVPLWSAYAVIYGVNINNIYGFIILTFGLALLSMTLSSFLEKRRFPKGYICMLCVVTFNLALVLRVILLVMIGIIIYFNNFPFSDVVQPFLRCFLVLTVSAGSALLDYTLRNLMAKYIMWIVGRCNNRVRGYSDYVPYRGFLCPFNGCSRNEETVTCCCKTSQRV